MKRFLIIISFMLVLLVIGIKTSTTLSQKSEWENSRQVITVVVCHGDTLYNLALEYKPSWMDTREYVYQVEQLNDMTNGNIYAGQTIKLYTMEG